MKRSRFTVRWDSKGAPGWVVRGPRFPLGNKYGTKAVALSFARHVARNDQPSQLVIFKKNGRIQTEHTYGSDPRRSPG